MSIRVNVQHLTKVYRCNRTIGGRLGDSSVVLKCKSDIDAKHVQMLAETASFFKQRAIVSFDKITHGVVN